MTATTTQARTHVTPNDRERLAVHINGRPLPPADATTIGPQFEREEAYRRADIVIADGWVPANAPVDAPSVRDQIAAIISGSPTPSPRSFRRADEILALLRGRA